MYRYITDPPMATRCRPLLHRPVQAITAHYSNSQQLSCRTVTSLCWLEASVRGTLPSPVSFSPVHHKHAMLVGTYLAYRRCKCLLCRWWAMVGDIFLVTNVWCFSSLRSSLRKIQWIGSFFLLEAKPFLTSIIKKAFVTLYKSCLEV